MSDFCRIDIPTVDLEGIYSNEKEDLERIARDVLDGASKYGLLRLENHGISMENVKNCFDLGEEYFALPDETKMKQARSLKPFQGYAKEYKEINGKSFLMNESYDMVSVELSLPEIDGFKEVVTNTVSQFFDLTQRIVMVLDIALESGDFFQNSHSNQMVNDESWTDFKLLRYPPVHSDIPVGTIRLKEHSDFGTLTLLQTMEGLQVQVDEDEWKTANIPGNAILMLFGELLQLQSNERLRATKHRVVVLEEEKRSQKARNVLAYFVAQKLDTIVKPLGGSTIYSPFRVEQFFENRANNLYGID